VRQTSAGYLSGQRKRPSQSGFGSADPTAPRPPADDSQGLSLWAQPGRPTKLRTGRLPFDPLQRLLSSCLDKSVGLTTSLSNSLIHKRRDSVVIVAGDKLSEGPSVELAAGSTEPRCQALSILEDVVRDRNSGFHTGSITACGSRVNARGTVAISGSRPTGLPSSPGLIASPLHRFVRPSSLFAALNTRHGQRNGRIAIRHPGWFLQV